MSSKRTIKTGVGSYVNKHGVPTYGFQGDEVEVHEDYLEEFDAVNVENGDGKPVEYERVGASVVSPDTPDKEKSKSTSAPGGEAPKKAATSTKR